MQEYSCPTLLHHCPCCGYQLEGLPVRHRCPECGTNFDRQWLLFGSPARAMQMAPLRIVQTIVLAGMSAMGWLWFWVGRKMAAEWTAEFPLPPLEWLFPLMGIAPLVGIFFIWRPRRRDGSVPFFVAIGEDEIVAYRAPDAIRRLPMETIESVNAPFGEGVLEFQIADQVVRVPYGQHFPATPNDLKACVHTIRSELQRRQERAGPAAAAGQPAMSSAPA